MNKHLKLTYRIFCIFGQFLLVYGSGKLGISSDSTAPVLNISDDNDLIDYSLFNNGSGIIIGSHGYELPFIIHIFIHCSAPYPITWLINGYVIPPDILKISQTTRGEIYQTELTIISKGWQETDVSTISSATKCYEIMDPSRHVTLDIFFSENNVNHMVHKGKLRMGKTSVLPCATSNPETKVELYEIKENGVFENLNNSYNPVEGFKFSHLVEGKFICNGSGILEINASKSDDESLLLNNSLFFPNLPGYTFHPRTALDLEAYVNEWIYLSCNSTMTNVSILPPRSYSDTDFIFNITNNSTRSKSVAFSSTKRFFGGIKCIDADDKVHWNWRISIIESLELHVHVDKRAVGCKRVAGAIVFISILQCDNPSHCEYLKRCFEEDELCSIQKLKQRDQCPLKNGGVANCITLPSYFFSGIIQCRAYGLTRFWHIFLSTTGNQIVHNWQDSAPEELVSIQEFGTVLYVNQTQIVVCRATKFLFTNRLTLHHKFRNDTIENLIENDETTIKLEDSLQKRFPGYHHKVAAFRVSPDGVAVSCLAHWFNSTDYFSVHRKFDAKTLYKPKFYSTKRTVQFLSNDEGKTITCSADEGEPAPQYSWFKDNLNLEDDPSFKLGWGSNGGRTIIFDKVNKSQSGVYVCNAINTVGNDTMEFVLNVSDAIEASYGFVIVGVIILFLVICLLIWILFRVYKAYKRAHELIRELREDEIQEFFNGEANIVNSGKPLNARNLELHPYDKEYEIPLEDLNFEESDVLGYGQYSYVLKGKFSKVIGSVAIKQSKPGTDVQTFKLILGEVKILIYIGKHKHIVSFIGACTENVRLRKIYIVFELCSRGSLESFLKENRKLYTDPITAEGSGQRFSFKTLLRWALEIAIAMEFVSDKQIIHGDLATRNVLLNENLVVKLSDFGLSKKLYESPDYMRRTKCALPWRWMAPESLSAMTFSTQSDVWSYGVTIWEIFSLGNVPFPQDNWNPEFVNRLNSGMRMGKPSAASDDVYIEMTRCWEDVPKQRPMFVELRSRFYNIYDGKFKDINGL